MVVQNKYQIYISNFVNIGRIIAGENNRIVRLIAV